jgi:hypothetical protein
MKNHHSTFWKKILLTLILLFNLSVFATALAQTPPSIIPDGTNQTVLLPHDTSSDTSGNYLNNRLLPGIASTIIALTGGLSLLFMVVAGIFLLTSYGSPERAAAAKKTITYALAGIIVSGLSYAIVAIIASINISKP